MFFEFITIYSYNFRESLSMDQFSLSSITIPDDDACNWINVFQECGYNNREVDMCMIRLNDTYASQKLGKIIDDKIALYNRNTIKESGIELTYDQIERAKAIILIYLRARLEEVLV